MQACLDINPNPASLLFYRLTDFYKGDIKDLDKMRFGKLEKKAI